MTNNKLDPNLITGFTDAEGCFIINVCKAMDCKTGYYVKL